MRGKPVALALATVALLVLAGAATPEGFALARGTPVQRLDLPEAPVFARYLVLVLGVLMVLAAAYSAVALVGGEGRQRKVRRAPVWVQILIFVLAVLVVARVQELFDRARSLPDESPGPASGSGTGVTDALERSSTLGLAVTAVLAVAVMAAIVLLIVIARRSPRSVAPAAEPGSELVGSIDAGIEELGSIEDPRHAVISCYARMERALTRAGVERRASDAPFEVLTRALALLRVPEDDARRLTELFERARFSPHAVDDAMRADALQALVSVRLGLERA